jgi:hypothetical protein
MMSREVLEQLYYDRRLSMMQIAHQLQVTHATVLYWMKKYGILRRSWSESAYVKLNPCGDPFALPQGMAPQQRELMNAALMLYWAEGSKKSGHIQIVNLDARVLKLFSRFLREVCKPSEAMCVVR